MTGRSEGKLH